jgi:hypothetical protein
MVVGNSPRTRVERCRRLAPYLPLSGAILNFVRTERTVDEGGKELLTFFWLSQAEPVSGIVAKHGLDTVRSFGGLETKFVAIEQEGFLLVVYEDGGMR